MALIAPPSGSTLTPAIATALADGADRIVITGAGGWLGMATLELIANALGPRFADRTACFGTTARRLVLCDGRSIDQRPLAMLASLDRRPTIVMHLAFLTRERAEMMTEEAYRAANRAIADTVLAALDPIGTRALFLASSGAARLATGTEIPAAMRLYGQLKRDDEQRFAAWAERTGRTAAIARIFDLTGRYINKPERYALADFITAALVGQPIKINAPHPVVRGYVAIPELMSVVFALLLEGAGVTRFDTGGDTIELGDLAARVAAMVAPVPVVRAECRSNAADHYVGDGTCYQMLRERYGVAAVGIDRQIVETADFLSSVAAGVAA